MNVLQETSTIFSREFGQGGGLKHVLFIPIFGEDSQFDYFFKSGWNHQLDLDKWEYSRMATAAASIEKKKLSAANFAGASCIGCFFVKCSSQTVKYKFAPWKLTMDTHKMMVCNLRVFFLHY